MSHPDTHGNTQAGWTDDGLPASDASANDRVVAAAHAQSEDWSADAVIALGDSHEKGEDSLCVGEAA